MKGMEFAFLLGLIIVIGMGLVGFIILQQVAGIDIQKVIGIKIPGLDLGKPGDTKTDTSVTQPLTPIVSKIGTLTSSEVGYLIATKMAEVIDKLDSDSSYQKDTCDSDWCLIELESGKKIKIFKLEKSWEDLKNEGKLKDLTDYSKYKHCGAKGDESCVVECNKYLDEQCLTAHLNKLGYCVDKNKATTGKGKSHGIYPGNNICETEDKNFWGNEYCKAVCTSNSDDFDIIKVWATEKTEKIDSKFSEKILKLKNEWSSTVESPSTSDITYATLLFWDNPLWTGRGVFKTYFIPVIPEKSLTIDDFGGFENIMKDICDVWTLRDFDNIGGQNALGATYPELRTIYKAKLKINKEIKFLEIKDYLSKNIKSICTSVVHGFNTIGDYMKRSIDEYWDSSFHPSETDCLTGLKATKNYNNENQFHIYTTEKLVQNDVLLSPGEYTLLFNSFDLKKSGEGCDPTKESCRDISMRICKVEETPSAAPSQPSVADCTSDSSAVLDMGTVGTATVTKTCNLKADKQLGYFKLKAEKDSPLVVVRNFPSGQKVSLTAYKGSETTGVCILKFDAAQSEACEINVKAGDEYYLALASETNPTTTFEIKVFANQYVVTGTTACDTSDKNKCGGCKTCGECLPTNSKCVWCKTSSGGSCIDSILTCPSDATITASKGDC